jgi:hypothetical protein
MGTGHKKRFDDADTGRNLLTEEAKRKHLLQKLFSTQLLAVLGTLGQRNPHGNLAAFTVIEFNCYRLT